MNSKSYVVSHGWVVSARLTALHGASPKARLLLRVRHADGETANLTIERPYWQLGMGAEISYAYFPGVRKYVVAVVDHTAEEGFNIYQQCQRRRPDQTDACLVGVVLAAALLALGEEAWRAWPLAVAVLAVYGIATCWLPQHLRQKKAASLAVLVDKDYQAWRESLANNGAL